MPAILYSGNSPINKDIIKTYLFESEMVGVFFPTASGLHMNIFLSKEEALAFAAELNAAAATTKERSENVE